MVYTPDDGARWLLAKQTLQAADYAYLQIVEHLYKVHMFMEPICVCAHRQLSTLHPLHNMLKHHCKGLLGANKFGTPSLLDPDKGTFDKLLAIGRKGSMQLLLRAYHDATWEDTNFRENIKVRKSHTVEEFFCEFLRRFITTNKKQELFFHKLLHRLLKI